VRKASLPHEGVQSSQLTVLTSIEIAELEEGKCGRVQDLSRDTRLGPTPWHLQTLLAETVETERRDGQRLTTRNKQD
jgi:hypothetical protein